MANSYEYEIELIALKEKHCKRDPWGACQYKMVDGQLEHIIENVQYFEIEVMQLNQKYNG